MKKNRYVSLPPGRNAIPLNAHQLRTVVNTFLGFEGRINARYESGTNTRFVVSTDDEGNEFGEIIFSEDIFPGNNVVNPNSVLSVAGAVAHELAHYHRWHSHTDLPHGQLTDIDEAMTSLEAALRYNHQLQHGDIQGLISDALYRLRRFVLNQD